MAFALLEPTFDRLLVWFPQPHHSCSAAHGMMYRWHPIWTWRPKAEGTSIWRDVVTNTTAGKGWHSADHNSRKPVSLMLDLVRAFGGTSVLDPYAGSCTTGAACAKLGIPCTMVEIEERFCEMGAARLSDDVTYGEPNLFNMAEAASV